MERIGYPLLQSSWDSDIHDFWIARGSEQGWHPEVQRLFAGLVLATLARAQGPEVCGGLGRLPLEGEVY